MRNEKTETQNWLHKCPEIEVLIDKDLAGFESCSDCWGKNAKTENFRASEQRSKVLRSKFLLTRTFAGFESWLIHDTTMGKVPLHDDAGDLVFILKVSLCMCVAHV